MRRIGWAMVKAGVSVGLAALLIRHIGLEPIVATIRSADPARLALALTIIFASNLLASQQWRVLLALAAVRLPGVRVVAFYLVGIFFNNFLPSSVGGDVSRIVDAGRASGRRAAVIGATLVDRLLGLVVIALLAALAAWQLRGRLAAHPAAHLVTIGVVALALVSCAGLGVLLSRSLSALIERWSRRLPAPLANPAGRFLAALAPLRARRGAALSLLFLSLVVQTLRIGTHAAVAAALDIHLELGYFFLFVPLLAALVMLPVSINGIGVRESMGAVLFGLAGVPPAQASAMQFLAYLVAVAASMAGGVIFLLRAPVGPIAAERSVTTLVEPGPADAQLTRHE